MASQEAIEARRSVIRGWLESGIKHGSIAVMIQTRFQVSRSTAYNEIGAVSQEITVSDDNAQDGNFTGNDPAIIDACLLYTSPSPRDRTRSRMPSSA